VPWSRVSWLRRLGGVSMLFRALQAFYGLSGGAFLARMQALSRFARRAAHRLTNQRERKGSGEARAAVAPTCGPDPGFAQHGADRAASPPTAIAGSRSRWERRPPVPWGAECGRTSPALLPPDSWRPGRRGATAVGARSRSGDGVLEESRPSGAGGLELASGGGHRVRRPLRRWGRGARGRRLLAKVSLRLSVRAVGLP
jgi:hypothetical protein